MILTVVTVALALALGLARGGRVGNLGDAPIARGWLLVAAVLLQAGLAFAGPSTWAFALLLASHAALVTFLWTNRILPGMSLALVGLLLNTLVIAANSGMPVSGEALRTVDPSAFVRSTATHRPLLEGARLWWLADVLPLPLLRTVVSVGDVVLAAGVGVLVEHLMRAPGGRARVSRAASRRRR